MRSPIVRTNVAVVKEKNRLGSISAVTLLPFVYDDRAERWERTGLSYTMNGAESLIRTLIAGGVDTCFTNPGTSEMHMVAALDRCRKCAACWAFSKVS